MRRSIADSVLAASKPELKVTFSGGLVAIDPSRVSLDLDSVLKSADESLYRAKAEGRNRIVVSEPASVGPEN